MLFGPLDPAWNGLGQFNQAPTLNAYGGTTTITSLSWAADCQRLLTARVNLIRHDTLFS